MYHTYADREQWINSRLQWLHELQQAQTDSLVALEEERFINRRYEVYRTLLLDLYTTWELFVLNNAFEPPHSILAAKLKRKIGYITRREINNARKMKLRITAILSK